MSELVTDLDWSGATRYPSVDEEWGPLASGRHAYDEDAALTPIFHALTRAGWPPRRREPAPHPQRTHPVDELGGDPLTAPVPVQARPGRRRRRAQPDTGRHHRVGGTARHGW